VQCAGIDLPIHGRATDPKALAKVCDGHKFGLYLHHISLCIFENAETFQGTFRNCEENRNASKAFLATDQLLCETPSIEKLIISFSILSNQPNDFSLATTAKIGPLRHERDSLFNKV
jgi:hypothetical protein